MTRKLDWKNFNKTNVRTLVGDSSPAILAVRRDGKGYFGIVNQVSDEYVELANGDHRQNLYYHLAPMQFTVIELPPIPTFKMAERRLQLEGKS